MSGRTRMIIAVALMILVLLLFFVFFIRPRQGKVADLNQQVEAENQRTVQLNAELQRLKSLQANAPRLQARLQKVRDLVPQSNQVPNFIFQVQEAADSSGVSFVSIAPELPKAPPEGASLAEVRLTIDAGGGYFALQDFIRRLYSLDRAVRIDTLTLTSNVAGAGTASTSSSSEAGAAPPSTNGEITSSMTARIFYELPAGASTSSTTTTTTTSTPVPTPTPTP